MATMDGTARPANSPSSFAVCLSRCCRSQYPTIGAVSTYSADRHNKDPMTTILLDLPFFFFFFFVRFISIIFQLTTLVFAAVLVQPLSVSDAIILISEQWRLSQLAAMDLHYRHQLYRKPHNRILFGLQKLYRLPPRKILRIY